MEKFKNNYYSSQFNKIGYHSVEELKIDEKFMPTVLLHHNGTDTNHMTLDAQALTEIYNILQAMNERKK